MSYQPVDFDKRQLKATSLYAPTNKDNPARNELMRCWSMRSATITQQIQQYLVGRVNAAED